MTEQANQKTPEAAIKGPGRSLYRPELDAVRFLAFLLVYVNHNISTADGSYSSPKVEMIAMTISRIAALGLPLFFVLSAYLIADLLLRERENTGTVNVGAFFKRRILRIWPLYIFGLMIGWLATWRSGQPETARFLASFLMMGNLYVMKFGWITNPMTPLWSMSVEEQFYLFWPWIGRGFSRKAMFAACGTLIALANGFLIYYCKTGAAPDTVVWCNSFVQFEMFAAGVLLALTLRQNVPTFRVTSRIGLGLGAAACWLAAACIFKPIVTLAASPVNMILGYAAIAGGCCLVLLSVLGVPSKSVPQGLRYLGRISFGLYVYHEFAIEICVKGLGLTHVSILAHAARFIALGLTIVLAGLSYRFLETPFLKLKGKFEIIVGRPENRVPESELAAVA